MELNQVKAVVLGHAVGDALGVPVEFVKRKTLTNNPVAGMEGYGTFPVPAGSWSDDTSMSLCTLDSLTRGKFNAGDIMRKFGKWLYLNEYTPTGVTFDVGNTCGEAIANYYERQVPLSKCGLTDERSNGNGSLMRIHPVALFLACKNATMETKIGIIHKASAITHAHLRSQIGCGIYSFVLWELLENSCKEAVEDGLARAEEYYRQSGQAAELDKYHRLFSNIKTLPIEEIKSGGYVVYTLEAAVWCLLNTDSYRDCVLTAVNLGEDADTVAGVAGGLAGALYGLDDIPQAWLSTLQRREYIETLCDAAYVKW